VQHQAEADQWQSRAEAALRAGEEDLARQAVARKLQSQQVADSYRQQYEAQDQQVEELQNALVQLESRISEATARRDLIIAKKNRAATQEAIQQTVRGLSSSNAMDKLDRMEERIDARLAQAEAMSKLEQGTLESRFSDLERNQEVDQELEALRRRISGQG
jgi:phage shock protein A